MPRKQNHEHPTEKVSAQPHFDQTAPEIQSYGTVSHSLPLGLEEHVRQLPPALQTAFRLRGVNGLSDAESSKAFGIRANAFRSRLLRARRKLVCGLKQAATARRH